MTVKIVRNPFIERMMFLEARTLAPIRFEQTLYDRSKTELNGI